MSWWGSRKKKQPEIPKFVPPTPPEPKLEPKPEPMIVEEVRDPSESAIIRFVHKLQGRE